MRMTYYFKRRVIFAAELYRHVGQDDIITALTREREFGNCRSSNNCSLIFPEVVYYYCPVAAEVDT